MPNPVLPIISTTRKATYMRMDLNCDMGESFGTYQLGDDSALLPHITSANIACGFHAGDALVMDRTVRLAAKSGVSIGAHPGYPDLQGFGRRNMDLTPEETEAMLLYQLGALAAFARAAGVEVTHIKPHGALYNQAAADRRLADAIARATKRFSRSLILVGLAGSKLIEAGIEAGLPVANEGFPDRAYNSDGTLMSRRLPGAVLEDAQAVVKHALELARNGIRISIGTETLAIPVDTLCLHGDHPNAAQNALLLRQALIEVGVEVQPLGNVVR
jgi:5-oxoprolinase (ATP-hydrolysing) subunit A